MRTTMVAAVTLGLGLALGAAGAELLHAQPAGLTRAMLLRTDLGIEGKEALVGTAELAPGAAAGRHAHPGDEIGYVLEGTAVLEVDGQPPVVLKAGDAYHVGRGRAHDARNAGPMPAKVVAVWVVDKGAPLAAPVP